MWYHHLPYWGDGRPWSWLGANDAFVDANIRVHDNRMWGEDYRLEVGDTFVRIMGGPHLFQPYQSLQSKALRRHYRDGFEGACTGCIGANISVTPDTRPVDIVWLNEINFACITRRKPCESEDELIPGPWSRRDRKIDYVSPETYSLKDVPVDLLGQEMPQAVTGEILTMKADINDPNCTLAQVRILQRLKNAETARPGSIVSVQIWMPIILADANTSQRLAPGQTYILGYYDPPNQPVPEIELKALIPATPQNLNQFQAGLRRDTSVGESEDWHNHMNFP